MALAVEGNRGVAVEVNSETDFVARNADFQVRGLVVGLGCGAWLCVLLVGLMECGVLQMSAPPSPFFHAL